MVGMEYFGDKLKAIRKAKQITQGELAIRLGVSTAIIAAYEQGKSYPSVAVLIKICEVLNASADYLLGISDNISINMGGLTDEEMQPFLQLIALVKQNREPED